MHISSLDDTTFPFPVKQMSMLGSNKYLTLNDLQQRIVAFESREEDDQRPRHRELSLKNVGVVSLHREGYP